MNEATKRLVYWTPRILCIAFAAFLAIFALDVFGMPIGPWHKVLALVLHLIPTWLVLLTLAVFHVATKWGQLDRATLRPSAK